jgi:hypothetical protein
MQNIEEHLKHESLGWEHGVQIQIYPIALVTKHHTNSDNAYDALSSSVMSVLIMCRSKKLPDAS